MQRRGERGEGESGSERERESGRDGVRQEEAGLP